jgi:hypothetical protein
VITDIGEAVESPQQLTGDPLLAQHILDLVPAVPPLVWGRDESQAGAPGWRAGLVVARRQQPIAD